MIATKSIQQKKADQKADQFDNIKVDHANYLDEYRLAITFSDGTEKIVDFSDFLAKYATGYISKYKNKSNFKRFKIDRGNVVWGREWDLIFPVYQLYEGKIRTAF